MKKTLVIVGLIVAAYLFGRYSGENSVLKYQYIHTDGKGKIISLYAGNRYEYQ